MERPTVFRTRILAGCALAVSAFLVASTGCRSLRPEVPPHRPFAADGRQAPPISFSGNGLNAADGLPPVTTGLPSAYGTPAPGAKANYGAPTENAFGPVGTSTLGSLPGGDATRPAMGGTPAVGLGNPAQPATGPGASPSAPR